MSAPNLVSPTTITAKTIGVNPANTNNTSAIANASSSGKAIKLIQSLLLILTGAQPTFSFDVYVYKGNATAFYIANNILVPGGATQVVSSKESYFYLKKTTLFMSNRQ